MTDTLRTLADTIRSRKNAEPGTSYVAQLNHKGLDKILAKIGEEATEVILAAKTSSDADSEQQSIVAEMADLWFHCMVLLDHADVDYADVLSELERRAGTSGLDEKSARKSVSE
ncbi:MAG: phosphoribosyl-ATP diphosphatase [Gammaproteobacteria bacterium]|nr:phosphoribosyl-ATP diphosphatase [Gammaproteobacteria bacterium]